MSYATEPFSKILKQTRLEKKPMPAVKSISKQLSNPNDDLTSKPGFNYSKPMYSLDEDDD